MASAAEVPTSASEVVPGLSTRTYEHLGTLFDASVVPEDRLLAVRGYDDVREDDVIVWTYPKAGTHWLADIVSKILHNGDLDKAFQSSKGDTAFEISPLPDVTAKMVQRGVVNRIAAGTLHELSTFPSPRVIMTHLLYDMLPQKVQDGKAKMIYIYRDPRDMAVSMWHQLSTLITHLNMPEMPLDAFLEMYMAGKVNWGLWSRHFKSCQTVKDRPHLLVLYYEQMLQDLKGTVKKISSFLGKELTEDVTDAITASCKFQAAKTAKPHSMFIRKGVSGDWKATFTVAQSEKFNGHMIKETEDLELSMPYGPH